MKITRIATNDQSEDGFESITYFDDGAAAYSSEKRVVLVAPNSTKTELCYKSMPTGPYGALMTEAGEYGFTEFGIVQTPMTDEEATAWLAVFPNAQIDRVS